MLRIVLPPEQRVGLGYREQPGCHCCVSCYVRQYPDQGPEHFCNRDGADIPLSSAELGLPYDAEREDAHTEELLLWEAGRRVAPYGICEQFCYKVECVSG
jgi:hypothetical protein